MPMSNAIGPKIKMLSNALNQAVAKSASACGLTSAQAFLLGYINFHAEQGVRPKDLEEEFGLRHSTISGILQRLEAKGFITCQTMAGDRRSKQISPTKRAKELEKQVVFQLEQVEAQLTAGFDDSEKQLLVQLLDRAAANVASTGSVCPAKALEMEELI